MSRFKTLIVLLLSCVVYGVCLYQLAQVDFQAIVVVRSLHAPFVERLGTLGNRVGDGLTLIVLCGGLWGIGAIWKNKTYQRSGIDGVVAHVLAGMTVQMLKHLIGRPRPRFTHQQAFDYGPSWQPGLDAFPSGHAAASLAVAAVLARYFPKGAWIWYGAAFFVGVSRVVRGSHFPTDVLGGALLGFLIGYVWARPLRAWRGNLVQAVLHTLPFVVGGCALFWRQFHVPMNHEWGHATFWTGLLVCALGMGARWIMTMGSRRANEQCQETGVRLVYANALIAVGMAVSTQWVWVVAVTLLACGAWIIRQIDGGPIEPPRWFHEVRLASLLIVVAVTLHGFPP